jgi:3D (Asp-Asp-Asp) domain-containing protein
MAGATAVLVPVSSAAPPSASKLRAQNAAIAQQKRSAVLSLYSLDARLVSANAHLAALQRREVTLREQRAVLKTELRLARSDARVSQQRLAQRLRALYDHGGASSLDLIFGAKSIGDALTQLDNLDRVTSVNSQILVQLRQAHRRELRTKQKLAAREARLQSAIEAAAAEARALADVRGQRAAYITQLASREALNAAQIARLDAQARAAETTTRQLTQSPLQAVSAMTVPRTTSGSLTMVSTGYCLTGTTATGIPVGWGVAAVDPRVIPLGTHLTIPGYGEAIAADTGGAIVGNRIDLWFPTCAQAGGWGWRSVTIALH